MAHPHFHSLSSVRQYGGTTQVYYPIHSWFDNTKQHIADARHRLVLHNLGGVSLALKMFGDSTSYTNSDGVLVEISNYELGLQHLTEDYGRTVGAEEILAYCGYHMNGNYMNFNVERALDHLIKRYKGQRSDYKSIVDFFTHFMYWSHEPLSRLAGLAFLNNSFGIFQLEKLLGVMFTRVSDGREIPTRALGETYVAGGYAKIPSLADVLNTLPQKPWMYINAAALSYEFDHSYGNLKSNKPQGVVPFPIPMD